MAPNPKYLDYEGFARQVGLKASTIRHYRRRGYLPEPDLIISGHAAWRLDTVKLWQDLRPGIGGRWQPEALAQLGITAK